MKHAFFATALVIAGSFAVANAASVLFDADSVRNMSPEEYGVVVSSAPDVNERDKDGTTPLHVTAAVGTPDKIAALLKAGADVEARGKEGRTPMHDAAIFGRPANIAALAIAGGRVEAPAKGAVRRTSGHFLADALLQTPSVTVLAPSAAFEPQDGRSLA